MQITVLYFQALREAAGTPRETLSLPEGTTAQEVLAAAIARHPGLAPYEKSVMLSIDEEWAARGDGVPNGATVGIMPPVSGG